MTSADDKTLTSARADMVELFGTCGVSEAAKMAREARELGVAYIDGTWECVSYSMKPILFQKCRSEKDEFDGGRGNKIGAILVVREVRGKFGRNFDRHMAAHGCSDEDVPDGVV